MQYKKIIKQSTETKIDVGTGEIIESNDRKEYKVAKEPDYIKLYIQDISLLMKLPNNDVLFCLLKKMNYDGEVIIIKPIAEEICKIAGIKNTEYFYKIINKYCEKNILIKKNRGLYLMNPFYFGRGKWEDILKIRLEIDYTANGREIKMIEFDKELY